MIKIRIKNADHEIDVRFPISENELYAKLAEIHAIEEKDAPQSAFVTEVYWPEEFSMLKDRFANLDELNYLAKRMESFDYGKKYCHYSPSIEESVLQEAIMKAVMQTAKQNAEVLKTLKLHIGMGLSAGTTEDNSLDLQIRIAEIEAEFQKMLKAIAADNVEAFDEEKAKLQIQLDRIADTKQKRENAKSRLDEIFTIIEALANHPISYDDQIVRQILESVIVESKEKIKVVFVGGLEVTQTI